MSSTTEKIWWKVRKLKDEYFTIAEIIQILWIWKKKWKSYIFCVFTISAFLKFVKHNKSKNIKEKNKKIHYFIFILSTLEKKKLLFHIRNGAHENTEERRIYYFVITSGPTNPKNLRKKGKNIYITICYSVKLFESRVESCKIFLFTLEQFWPFKYHK